MFAILLHEGMSPFYNNISSFPTVVFTFFLGFSVLFWLVSILGVFDIDAFEIEIAEGNIGGIGGVLMKIGLNGVPLPIIITILSLTGWILCYIAVALINPFIPGRTLEFVVGIGIMACVFYISVLITAIVIKPLRKLFKQMEAPSIKHVIGQVAVVRSSRVDDKFGEAILEDGGAGLLLRVRSRNNKIFNKGDKVVLLERHEESGTYSVISENEFNSN